MAEQIANLGYMALKEETASGTPVTPDVFVPVYEETFTTNINVDEDNPVVGNRSARFQVLRGQRTHTGSFICMAEPNTSLYIWSMLLARGSVTGSGPYTWPFTLGDPVKTYTIEFGKGNAAFRYWGVKARSIVPSYDENKMRYNVDVAALGSFTAREVLSITGTGPWVVTFNTNYDPNPTKGLVAADIVQFLDVSTGDVLNSTVTSVDNVTDVTFPVAGGGDEDLTALAAGDVVYLRKLTPSLTIQAPFTWARQEFRFGVDASTALSAAHTPLEKGSEWNVTHRMQTDEGEMRSGSYDPAAIVHTQGEVILRAMKFFDTLEDFNRFVTVAKRACVARAFSDPVSGTDQELRITMNNLRASEAPTPLKTGEIFFSEFNFLSAYDVSDAQMFDVTVINNLAAL